MDPLSIVEMVALFGKFYKDGGQSVRDIAKKIYAPTQTEKLFFRVPTTSTVIDKATYSIGEVLQRNQAVFVHKGEQSFEPERIVLEDLMIDYAQTPQIITESWLGFLVNSDNDPKSAPLVKYTIENLISQAAEDYENNLYKAKREAVVAGQPTPTVKSFTGIKEKFKQYNAEGKLNVGSQGTPPNAASLGAAKEMVEYMEDFIMSVPPEYRAMIDNIICSEEHSALYKRGLVQVYNTYYAQIKVDGNTAGDESEVPVMFASQKVKGVRSHLGTDAIWMTARNNAVMGVKNGQNEGSFIASVKDNKLVQLSSSWWKGFGFVNPNWVWHNGQDLV